VGWKQEMQIMTQKSRFWVESICSKGSKMVIFSNFGGLAGDFCKDTYEEKLFGMHIGSVPSGFHAGNVNTDYKISIVGYGDVWRGVKKRRFFDFWRPWRGLL